MRRRDANKPPRNGAMAERDGEGGVGIGAGSQAPGHRSARARHGADRSEWGGVDGGGIWSTTR